MSGVKAAITYGYSNTRVKAMESKLIKKEALQRMIASKETSSIIGMLLQTDYKENIEEFGGAKTMDILIDFALSKNLGHETSKLISITPSKNRALIVSIAGMWDVNNIKVIVGAIQTHKSFEDVSRYVIDSNFVSPDTVKECIATNSVESALNKLLAGSMPYSSIVRAGIASYKKSGSLIEFNAVIDKAYYTMLGSTISKLMKADYSAARLIRSRIDMKNALMLLRAKKYNQNFSVVSDYLAPNGGMKSAELEKLYQGSKDLNTLAGSIRGFELKDAIAEYNASKNKPLLIFEIWMMKDIFQEALRVLRHSVLSFGAIVAFFYLKEIEVFTIRILVKGKSYALSDEEIKGMIEWLK